MNKGEIKIFQSKDWNTEILVRFEKDTIWLSQEQISLLFWVNRPAVTKHINNIFLSWELDINSVCSILEHTAKDGKNYKKKFYNLDMIISVWYRVNSKEATKFRIWASKILKEYLIKWYSINQKILQEKWLKELESTINLVKKSLKSWDLSKDEALGLLDIITNYTNSWLLLQNYDSNKLLNIWKTRILDYKLDSREALNSIQELKKDLINKKQASKLFANEKDKDSLEGIFWNIYQTFDSQELYESTEEKAANLLYFIIKDHPFCDWNKRSWAFLFILFLAKNNILYDSNWEKKINDRALVAITLLIAESNPKDKEIMIKLLINLIN